MALSFFCKLTKKGMCFTHILSIPELLGLHHNVMPVVIIHFKSGIKRTQDLYKMHTVSYGIFKDT